MFGIPKVCPHIPTCGHRRKNTKNGETQKTRETRRIRELLWITIDPENYEYLKESGINASRLVDIAINEIRSPISLISH